MRTISAHEAQPWENCVTKGTLVTNDPREAMQGGYGDQMAGNKQTQSPSPRKWRISRNSPQNLSEHLKEQKEKEIMGTSEECLSY